MVYEHLKDLDLNPVVMTLITDGVSNHSKTVAVVSSRLFENTHDTPVLHVLPGASPENSVEYSEFTRETYDSFLPVDPDNQISAIQEAMSGAPFVLTYNHSFFLKFLRRIPEDLGLTASLNPDIIIDICDIASSAQYMDKFIAKVLSEDIAKDEWCYAFQNWLKGRREVQAGVPFAKIAASVDDSMWDENMPRWLRNHCKLCKAAEMF